VSYMRHPFFVMHYTYILHSATTNKYYIGCCENMDIRLEQHNSGRNASTKAGVPWVVMKTETFLPQPF
ncbi:MAG: hypothetical protein EBZ77_15360, partial [Chitinophagia bacterium]|nr:hypothetical protein [Chitinophagia bacterium]